MHSSRRLRLFALLALAAFSLSCGGESTSTTPPPPAGTVAVALSSISTSVPKGTTETIGVTVTRGGSFTGSVSLVVEGAPAGVGATMSSASLAAGATTATLNITVASSVADGSYPITIRASGTGVTAATALYTLIVIAPPPPTYSVRVAPDTLRIQEGDSATTTVTIRRENGFAAAVGLIVSGAPTNVTARATPNSTTDSTAALRVTVAVGVPAGTYTLTMIATTATLPSRSAPVTLIVTPKPSAGTLTLSPSSITVVQSQSSAPVVVRIARAPGATGDVQLSFQSFANEMTGTFTPNPVTGDSALLVINTTLLTGSGTITGVVRATVGGATTTANLVVTTQAFVPPDIGLSVAPTAAVVTAGNATSARVGINRVNFAGAVTFAVSGAPAGVTATVTPSPTTADSAVLNITTTASVTPSVYPLVLSATGAGITGARTTNFSLTVNAATGVGNVQWAFCDATRKPLWFATRSGTSGSWAQATESTTSTATTYSFAFPQAGQVAYVHQGSAGFDVTVFNTTASEILPLANNECLSNVGGQKTLNGTVSNLLQLRGVSVSAGGANTIVPTTGGAFTLQGVRNGPIDVMAYMGVLTVTGFSQFDRVILRRDVTPATGTTLADFDFAGSEWLFSSSANHFFENFGTDAFIVTRSYLTANGNIGAFSFELPNLEAVRGLAAMPTALRRAGDLHQGIAATAHAVTPRSVTFYSTGIGMNGPIVFGPTLNAATVTVLGSSPVRLRTEGMWQTEYDRAAAVTYTQSVANPNARSVTISMSRDFPGASGSGFAFEVPDFGAAPGWNPLWMLRTGVTTSHSITATGLATGASFTPADGVRLRTGSNIGSITP